MNSSAKSNMYEVNAESVLGAYGAFVEGTPAATAMVAAADPLGGLARTALERSFAQLGYGEGTVAWLRLTTDGMTLGPQELATIAEGIDPAAVVLADEAATALFARAYRCELDLEAAARVLGRRVVTFSDFSALLDDSEAKQRAWALLKRLRVR